MKGLLILSIFIFSFLIGRKNKNPFNSFLISLSLVLAPVIALSEISLQTLVLLVLYLLLFFLLSNSKKNSVIRKILFVTILIYTTLTTLYLSGIFNNKLQIELKNIYVFNSSNIDIIKNFQSEATYLPIIIRPIIYNYSEIIFEIIVRSLYFISLDKIVTFLGFSFIYLIYLALLAKKNFLIYTIPSIILLIVSQSTFINSHYLYLLSIPSFIYIFNKNIKRINIPILLSTVLISCLYSLL